MLTPDRVQIAIPTRGSVYFGTLVRLQAIFAKAPTLPPVMYEAGTLGVDYVRNQIVKRFLHGSCEALLMVDDDIMPNGDVMQLLDVDADIVAAPYLFYRAPEMKIPAPCVFRKNPAGRYAILSDPFSQTGIQPVAAVGTGCMLVHRRVFEHPDLKPPFTLVCDEDGCMVRTEDVEFCDRATRAGFTIKAHWDLPCEHVHSNVGLLSLHRGYEKAYAMARTMEDDRRLVQVG